MPEPKRSGTILWIVVGVFGILLLSGDWDGDGFDGRNPKPRASGPTDPCADNVRFERVHSRLAPYPTWFLTDGYRRTAVEGMQAARPLERMYQQEGRTVVYADELNLCEPSSDW